MVAWKNLVPLFIGSFLLSACDDQPKLWKRSEIENIAEDFADAAASNNASTIDHNANSSALLKERVDELERRIELQDRQIQLQDRQIQRLSDHQSRMTSW